MAREAVQGFFELSRYMGAGLTMIDRHYGHLPRNIGNRSQPTATVLA